MRYKKQVIGRLEKCYALSRVQYRGSRCLLVAAEKHAPCVLFSEDGDLIDTVWEEPGGVMTMVPIPGREGAFLSTQRFYSPNDCTDAKLVLAEDTENGWRVTDVCELPGVHRFGILSRGGVNYVVACTLKTDHEYRDDWRFPGKIWVGVLPEKAEQLRLEPWMSGLLRNHGFTLFCDNGNPAAIVSCELGVYRVEPPPAAGGAWKSQRLLEQPASDAVCVDLDEDGVPELFVISPFHGDEISIWRLQSGVYVRVYLHPEKMPFLHAIDAGQINEKPVVLVGNREGRQELLAFFYDRNKDDYVYEVVDAGHGPANCMIFDRGGRSAILAANRETDEIAIYDVLSDETEVTT